MVVRNFYTVYISHCVPTKFYNNIFQVLKNSISIIIVNRVQNIVGKKELTELAKYKYYWTWMIRSVANKNCNN